MWGWLEPESRRVSNIEIVHPPPGGFNPVRFANDVTDGIGEVTDSLCDRDAEIC